MPPLHEEWYLPCLIDAWTGRITRPLSTMPMTRLQAEQFLREVYPDAWRRCEAIPQPVSVIPALSRLTH